MELLEAIEARHSVRSYSEQKIEGDVLEALRQRITRCNQQSGLHIQLCLEEPEAFSGMMARYGNFSGVHNYLALVGKKGPDLDENCGYYGEQLVILAQQLGLNTCWVGATYSKNQTPAVINPGEKLRLVIALGYGTTQGRPHKGKTLEQLNATDGPAPPWFMNGLRAVQLAPTAVNQQKFRFACHGNRVTAERGNGFYTKVDLGIAKYHFEVGAGQPDWTWA